MSEAASTTRYLKPADLVDNFTRSLYKVAPYQGCAHGCRYCDGRAERYYVEGDFERDIVVRRDIPERLARDLPRLRESGTIAFGSGTTDPYQPCEAEEEITGQCARILSSRDRIPRAEAKGVESHKDSGEPDELPLFEGGPPLHSLPDDNGARPRLPVLVMTKSALVLRDLGPWREVNQAAGFVLLMSVTSIDEGLRETMEPGASSFADRLRTLKTFKEAGCVTGILAMPFLPGLSDSEDSIRRLYEAAKGVGVDFMMPGGLTLRPGRQKEFYLRALEDYRPDLLSMTRELYAEERPSGWPGARKTAFLTERLRRLGKESALPWLLPHAAYARLLPPHDAFRVLLRDMVELYADRATDTGALRRSADRYDRWLVEGRREFRKARKLPASWLEERFLESFNDGAMKAVLDNPKLLAFASAVCLEGARLNYLSLKLE